MKRQRSMFEIKEQDPITVKKLSESETSNMLHEELKMMFINMLDYRGEDELHEHFNKEKEYNLSELKNSMTQKRKESKHSI